MRRRYHRAAIGSEVTRQRLVNALDKVGLLRPATVVREHYVSLRTPEGPETAPDGLPLPPPRLRLLVDGRNADWSSFLDLGRWGSRMVRTSLSDAGVEMRELQRILDFGCGCGRVARHWVDLEGPEVHGCDYNVELVQWCRSNLPFLRVAQNALAPPSPYPDATFDFVYALSVLTHLDEGLQRDWMTEFRRILKPGGLLLFTTLGEFYAQRLPGTQLARFRSGRLVVERARRVGENACSVYHPAGYVRESLLAGFSIVSFVDAMTLQTGRQDVYLVRAEA